MKVALFIGHHKTGSTSLQGYFCNNYDDLLRKGILYPAVESEGVAANLRSVLRGKRSEEETRFNVREPHNALAFKLLHEVLEQDVPRWHPNLPSYHQMMLLIQHQVRELAPDHLVLCSEVFSRLGGQGWRLLLPKLHDALASDGTTIVLNLRRPDKYLASWHQQRLKFGAKLSPLREDGLKGYLGSIHFRVDQIAERWSEVFTDATLILRNYDDVLAAGGSVTDFFAQTGLPKAVGDDDAALNPSVPFALAEVARLANHTVPSIAVAVMDYLLAIGPRIDLTPNAQVEMFGAANRDVLCKAFEPVHRGIAKMAGRTLFFPDIDEARTVRPVAELEALRAALPLVQADVRQAKVSEPVRDFITGFRLPV